VRVPQRAIQPRSDNVSIRNHDTLHGCARMTHWNYSQKHTRSQDTEPTWDATVTPRQPKVPQQDTAGSQSADDRGPGGPGIERRKATPDPKGKC